MRARTNLIGIRKMSRGDLDERAATNRMGVQRRDIGMIIVT
jgi:hypothetical protein